MSQLGFGLPYALVLRALRALRARIAQMPNVTMAPGVEVTAIEQDGEPDRPCTLVIGPKNHRRREISHKPAQIRRTWSGPSARGSCGRAGSGPTTARCDHGRRAVITDPTLSR
jgi:hypothetical protein